jgi:acyl-CoA reductase-like NAD-dependent aldehyde dehydrogenase
VSFGQFARPFVSDAETIAAHSGGTYRLQHLGLTDAFCSIKESGWGKEGGAEAILDFCKVKAVIVGGGK